MEIFRLHKRNRRLRLKAQAARRRVVFWTEATVAVLAAIALGVVAFDLLNFDGYVGRLYAAASGRVWPYGGQCVILLCLRQ